MTETITTPTLHQEITAAEQQQAHLYLQQTESALKGAIKGLSDAQWRFTETPDRWSIAEIVEHIVFVTEHVGGPRRQMLAQAAAPPAGRDYKHVDSIVIHQFPTRLAKFSSPESALPGDRFKSPSEALTPLTKSFSTLAEFLDQTADLRDHALEAPPLKAVTNGTYDVMDGYQWILAAAAHAVRHTKQILEVKAHENFPVG